MRRTRGYLQRHERRRTRLRRNFRRDGYGHADAAMRRLPPAHLGILRRRAGDPRQSQGEDGSDSNEGLVPQAIRLLEPLSTLGTNLNIDTAQLSDAARSSNRQPHSEISFRPLTPGRRQSQRGQKSSALPAYTARLLQS